MQNRKARETLKGLADELGVTTPGSERSGMKIDITGEYVAQRGGGAKYSYEGSWRHENDELLWEAIVRRGGEVKARPSGRITNARGVEGDLMVKRLIEDSIERLS